MEMYPDCVYTNNLCEPIVWKILFDKSADDEDDYIEIRYSYVVYPYIKENYLMYT